jgi:hypothetical protein
MLTVAEGILDSAASEYRDTNLADASAVEAYAELGCKISLTLEECEKVRTACMDYIANSGNESNDYFQMVVVPLSE